MTTRHAPHIRADRTRAVKLPPPFAAAGDGLRVFLRVRPGAGRDAVGAPAVEADGGVRLKVSVAAPAEGGKANAALIKLLAKEWRLPKSAFEIAAGAGGRRKTLFVHGPPDTLAATVGAHIAAVTEPIDD